MAERCVIRRLLLAGFMTGAASAGLAEEIVKPNQQVSTNLPPASPEIFNPDPNPVRLPDPPPADFRWKHRVIVSSHPPALFNPDPGASLRSPAKPPVSWFNEPSAPTLFEPPEIPAELKLPRTDVRVGEFVPPTNPPARSFGDEPVPKELKLPREKTRRELRVEKDFFAQKYGPGKTGHPTNTVVRPDRWRIGFTPWKRYTSGEGEQPFESPEPRLWHPYHQSLLKGDLPVIGQDIFLDLTASAQTINEFKRVPTPSGVSAASAGAAEFFGQSEQISSQNYFGFSMNLFQGETVFRPVDWAIKIEPVMNVNQLDTQEHNVVSPNPQQGTERTKTYLALQQAFVELHLKDLSANYDSVSVRAGNQPFNADFRGFLFNDINLGLRLFGNYANNVYQYNLAIFDMREKDTFSDLNTFDARDQQVVIANLYRQDFIWPGYTASWSLVGNFDHGGLHYDRAGNLTRPAPLGTVRAHDENVVYLGWGGDGHIGRFNISHQFYQALGRDEFNGLAGRGVDINAQMAALEISYDRDWARYKVSALYASGDEHATDGQANGFDTIVDNPNFTGGPFSFWTRQGFNLAGTGVGLKTPSSLFPNLRTSKSEGQANFVNPGVFIFGVGAEFDVTPKLRSFFNANYIRMVETDPIQTALLTQKIDAEIGWDLSLGFQYRPLLIDNIIVSAGFGVLIPGQGYKDIYQTSTLSVPGFPGGPAGAVDDFLYSGLIAVTFTY
jgi:hypothetical protein